MSVLRRRASQGPFSGSAGTRCEHHGSAHPLPLKAYGTSFVSHGPATVPHTPFPALGGVTGQSTGCQTTRLRQENLSVKGY